ncbi:cupin domain-containing protein [Haloarchaeobius sp. HME9146]|uniref:cupin domain-containing protein n=1 Tax=unclassified Haloarchaeobius TaxID=2614452 RepID=UPI0021C0CBE3|nr:cupin domain-containing protein [Haloarchaeobius sp. HME9146]MCT9098332.1 cupin domain-containing protein [Haloarchaeobius sp. HME9146]
MTDIADLNEFESTPHAEVFAAPGPRVVRLQLEAGDEMPEHSHPGETIVLHVLAGELDLRLDGEPNHLQGDELIRFDGDQDIQPRALSDTKALLFFCTTE